MAEIDTTAPFASVRDAVNMFGERSPVKTQRIFPTVNAANTEKIISLETDLHQTRQELAQIQLHLATAESKAAGALKELAETKSVLEENKKKAEKASASTNLAWQAHLDATLEKLAHMSTEIENRILKTNNVEVELEEARAQQKNTLSALKDAEEENSRLKEEMVSKTNALMETQEREAKEQANLAAQRIDDLLKDLCASKDLLAKTDLARQRAEKELLMSREEESERLNDASTTAAVEIEKLRSELKDAEGKQEEIIAAVEKLKDELNSTKESEKMALRRGSEANLNLQRMKIDVEDGKLAQEKARVLLIQLDETNVKLKTATEQEKSLLASLASLKAELKNTNTELSNWKKEAEESSAEMEEQLSQLQRDLDVALLGEDKARASITRLNDALHQIKYLKARTGVDVEFKKDGPNVTVSCLEYETLQKQVLDSIDLANKRVAAALAQADAAKAGELEMIIKMEAAKNLVDASQIALKQSIQRAEAAEAAKSAVERELRRWRSESEQRQKATVAAVIQAVGCNGTEQKSHPVGNGEGPLYRRTFANPEAVAECQNAVPIRAPQPRESLAQVLQYNFPSDEKAKKNNISTKLGSYFTKKVK